MLTIDKDCIEVLLTSCRRCGRKHYVKFYEFEGEGLLIDGQLNQYWGLCPQKKEPVFMSIDD